MGCLQWPDKGEIATHRAALPNAVVIGAMKCGTSALHRYLDEHPDVHMSDPKELNFFVDPCEKDGASGGEQPPWKTGAWHLGVPWLASQFEAGTAVRGESSPGYTSPSHPGVADRMAAVVPDARLIYIVRDPLERAISQYRHHRGEGAERRSVDEALLDPRSQYISRGLYHERLLPFLSHFPAERILVIATEELREQRAPTLASAFRFLGVDDGFWCRGFEKDWHRSSGETPVVDDGVRSRLRVLFKRDAERLRDLAGRDFPHWTV